MVGSVAVARQPPQRADDDNAPEGTVFECNREVKVYGGFDEMGLRVNLLRGIYGYGYEVPSPIQQRAIAPLVEGGDLIAQAQSGTGKTGAFAVGLLQRVDFGVRSCQGLVLEPTRELADQTEGVIANLGAYLCDDRRFCGKFVGGTPVRGDRERLREGGVLIAVGTPGRVNDLLNKGVLAGSRVAVLVVDEADEMLGSGFEEQVRGTFQHLPRDVQVALFSATLPPEVLALTQRFMRRPTEILVKTELLTLKGISQFYVEVEEEFKLETLLDLYSEVRVAQSVIFCNKRLTVDWLKQRMDTDGHTVSAVHAEMGQTERGRVLRAFRSGSSRVLITTDLVARGIDVHQVSIVVNYDLPPLPETYLHRIGRSGRYGRKGLSVNFVTKKALRHLTSIAAHYSTTIDELPADFQKFLQ